MKNEEKNLAAGTLFMGVFLGVIGSLLAGVFDRHFVHLGTPYDLFVAALFFISVWWLDRFFRKTIHDEQFKKSDF